MRIASIFGTLALAWLAGCAAAPDPNSLDYDPLEESNRIAHENNKQIDRAIFGPLARSYGQIPAPMRQGVTNLRYNWKLPGQSLQSVLQLDGNKTAENVTRFLINTTLGLGGLLDPAAAAAIGAMPSAVASASAAPMSHPITAPGITRSWPPRRRASSQTCQPSVVMGWLSRTGQSAHASRQAAQYRSPPPKCQSARARRRFFPHPAAGPSRRRSLGTPRRSATPRAARRCARA